MSYVKSEEDKKTQLVKGRESDGVDSTCKQKEQEFEWGIFYQQFQTLIIYDKQGSEWGGEYYILYKKSWQ